MEEEIEGRGEIGCSDVVVARDRKGEPRGGTTRRKKENKREGGAVRVEEDGVWRVVLSGGVDGIAVANRGVTGGGQRDVEG